MNEGIFKRLWKQLRTPNKKQSFLRYVASGGLLRGSDLRGDSDIADILSLIQAMRNLANDSQISTALSYYATDSTMPNSSGDVIWATSSDPDLARIINEIFKRLKVNNYARDHILELATIGNYYMPTTDLYRELGDMTVRHGVVLDNNTILDDKYDLVTSHKIDPKNIIHVWEQGQPMGYIYQLDEDGRSEDTLTLPESAVIHFSLGGMLGDYTITSKRRDGSSVTYDIQFAKPLMSSAIIPTQTLSMLEDALLLSSFARTIKFINVDCSGAEEEEIGNYLQQIKDSIEQQMSMNTANGDAQSFLNPQSPNNFIYVTKTNGQDTISITDLNMAQATEADNTLLDHYQDKKLSVLGIPKEAMNYSSNEGLGGAGSVLSQRSAYYANILTRIQNAYKNGWRDALNMYFTSRNLKGYVDKFDLHMSPIITTQSTIQFDKRDSTLNQASAFVQLLNDANVQSSDVKREGLSEILTEAFPKMGASVTGWKITPQYTEDTGATDLGGGPGAL